MIGGGGRVWRWMEIEGLAKYSPGVLLRTNPSVWPVIGVVWVISFIFALVSSFGFFTREECRYYVLGHGVGCSRVSYIPINLPVGAWFRVFLLLVLCEGIKAPVRFDVRILGIVAPTVGILGYSLFGLIWPFTFFSMMALWMTETRTRLSFFSRWAIVFLVLFTGKELLGLFEVWWMVMAMSEGAHIPFKAMVVEERVREQVPVVKHPYLAIEFPVTMQETSRNYFVNRTREQGMTQQEKSRALEGDRLLKLVLASVTRKSGKTVAWASAREQSYQSELALYHWAFSKGIRADSGKKTISSFAEVCWGDVFEAFEHQYVTMSDIVKAYEVFDKEVELASVQFTMPEALSDGGGGGEDSVFHSPESTLVS